MDLNSAEHKISSDVIIDNDTWAMNTLNEECYEFAAREIDEWQKRKKKKTKRALALCYSLLLFGFIFVPRCGENTIGEPIRIFPPSFALQSALD